MAFLISLEGKSTLTTVAYALQSGELQYMYMLPVYGCVCVCVRVHEKLD